MGDSIPCSSLCFWVPLKISIIKVVVFVLISKVEKNKSFCGSSNLTSHFCLFSLFSMAGKVALQPASLHAQLLLSLPC